VWTAGAYTSIHAPYAHRHLQDIPKGSRRQPTTDPTLAFACDPIYIYITNTDNNALARRPAPDTHQLCASPAANHLKPPTSSLKHNAATHLRLPAPSSFLRLSLKVDPRNIVRSSSSTSRRRCRVSARQHRPAATPRGKQKSPGCASLCKRNRPQLRARPSEPRPLLHFVIAYAAAPRVSFLAPRRGFFDSLDRSIDIDTRAPAPSVLIP